MEYHEAKEAFIEAWGTLGLAWGINKTMAQIFALLLMTPDPLSVEQIMEELKISRGNCSMNLRALIDWRLIHKTAKKGERREYFTTDKSFWDISKMVAYERSKRELDPLLNILEHVKHVDSDRQKKEVVHFRKQISEITDVVQSLDSILQLFVNSDSNWVANNLGKMLKKQKGSKPRL